MPGGAGAEWSKIVHRREGGRSEAYRSRRQSVALRTAPTAARIPRAMPIYEYDCADCRRPVSLLVLRPSAAPPPTCPRCGSTSLSRLMSRFVTVKSEEARLDALADSSSLGDLDENDPGSVARFMKKMGREFGDDLGDDFGTAVDEAMAETDGGEGDGAGAADTSDTSDP
jgi:putative FmdB family regulatory protein